MKIEIRSHFWPKTPDLREIKILIDDEIIRSSFLNQDQIWDLAKQMRYLDYALMDIGNSIEY
jgi:hypothetical protein